MSTDSSENGTAGGEQGGESTHSVRTLVNDTCLRQLETEGVMDEGRRSKLRTLLSAVKLPKADEFVSLFQEKPDEAVQ
ncbi:MAG: hypothetical protein CMJ35_02495 [Phycisphaerae bacterium]|nr:hypothetical protein [Phycisphaerae bacterium]MBM90467.1 hypothetical protein [Phycisphaerae bacterium]HCT45231.1 hypothetical protein [Phycisphaerales bacterium]|tara:strand:- start:273 stop:506 length:234 start_codon:yes stop_codon:yes gene_type:complete